MYFAQQLKGDSFVILIDEVLDATEVGASFVRVTKPWSVAHKRRNVNTDTILFKKLTCAGLV